jgi:hypothetical protein
MYWVTEFPASSQTNSIKLTTEVFTQHIIDITKTNLTLTKVIEIKKDSYKQLRDSKKIPKSLCIKVEPTTSPSYASNQDFIKLKKMLTEVLTFIENSTGIMKDVVHIYRKKLTHYRMLLAILSNVIKILNGLASLC